MIVYIAGPYTRGDVVLNIREACLAADAVLAAGHVPVVPHLSGLWHMVSPKDYETWLAIDLAIMRRCDAVLRIPGESPGAEREVTEARLCSLPVYYSVEALPNES